MPQSSGDEVNCQHLPDAHQNDGPDGAGDNCPEAVARIGWPVDGLEVMATTAVMRYTAIHTGVTPLGSVPVPTEWQIPLWGV
jgi:hypothetical protein